MSTFYQIPIRCRLSIVSNPPAYPIDDNTGQAPKFWRGQDVSIQVGVFDADNNAVDLSNVASLQITFRRTPTSVAYAATDVVDSRDIIPTISYAGWSAGTTQQATFNLPAALTDLSLDGGDSLPYWMDIRGYTSTGSVLVYGAGYVTVYNPGNAVEPISSLQVVSQGTTNNSTGDSTILPLKQIHTQKIVITGAARTSRFIISDGSSYRGARVTLSFTLPSMAGIVLEVYSEILSGSPLTSFTTDGEVRTMTQDFEFNGLDWTALTATIPAF